MSILSLSLVHAKYSVIETVRIPIALIGSFVFPALALVFFVVPQRMVADDPVLATQAVISLSVFAIMVNSLFSFGLTIAENREKPWDPYLRTLPAPGIARVLAHVFSTGTMGLLAIVPVVLVGAFFTAADASFGRILFGFLVLAVASLPFMFIGISIGFAMSSKAAIAVIQIVMFGLAFIGGLFLPPVLFADWLNNISKFTPSRQAREAVIWAVQGGTLDWWVWVGVLAWTAVTFALALLLFRRDQGRRFR